MYYNHDGEPISLDEWGALMGIVEYRIVGNDYIHVEGAEFFGYNIHSTGVVRVSTVWLGLDHAMWGPVPMIFETMIFGGVHDGECWRYPNVDVALAGHAGAVALVRREAATINSLREVASPAPEQPSDQ